MQMSDAGSEGAHLPQKPEVAVPEMPACENAEAAELTLGRGLTLTRPGRYGRGLRAPLEGKLTGDRLPIRRVRRAGCPVQAHHTPWGIELLLARGE